jgi:hypothetical protein
MLGGGAAAEGAAAAEANVAAQVGKNAAAEESWFGRIWNAWFENPNRSTSTGLGACSSACDSEAGMLGSAGASGSAKGILQVRTVAEANQAMVAGGNLAAWGGTTVTTEVVPAGTTFNMVVSEGQAQALMAGKPAFGGWATPDAIPSQAFARNNLAILPDFKPDVSFVVQVETTAPQTLNQGIVGSLGEYAGGANQVEFLGTRNLKLVGQPQPLKIGQ